VDALEPRIRALFATLEHAGEPESGAADQGAPGQGAAGNGAAGNGAAGAVVLRGEAGLESAGTRVRFMLRLVDERLLEVRYRAYGCPHTLATCEWLARSLEGQCLDALAPGSPVDWARQLGVPDAKLGRLLVIEDALLAALRSRAASGASGVSEQVSE